MYGRCVCVVLVYSCGPLSVSKRALAYLAAGSTWCIGGQHAKEANDEIAKSYAEQMKTAPNHVTHFDLDIVRFNTTVQVRRRLAGIHNRAQHSGSMNNLHEVCRLMQTLFDEDPDLTRSLGEILEDTIVQSGFAAKSGSPVCFLPLTVPDLCTASLLLRAPCC